MEKLPLWKALIAYPLMGVILVFWFGLLGMAAIILWPVTKLLPPLTAGYPRQRILLPRG
jgi:hypothetical protein